MEIIKKFVSCALMIVILFNMIFLMNIHQVNAFKVNTTLILDWTVSVDHISNEGNKYAGLTLDWATPQNFSANGGNTSDLSWKVTISQGKTVIAERTYPFSKKADYFTDKIGWNQTYTIKVVLLTNNEPTDSVSKDINIGPVKSYNDEVKADTECAIQNLQYYPAGAYPNDIIFTWTKKANCRNTGVKITTPDKHPLSAAGSDTYQVEDKKAVPGTYTFESWYTNNTKAGTTTIKVDINKVVSSGSTNPTNTAKQTNQTQDASAATANATGGKKLSCQANTFFGLRVLGALANPMASFQEALCNAQLFFIDMMSQLVGSIIEYVLYPSLGLPVPRGYNK